MKFVSVLLSILYLGTLYLVRAEKRNIRRVSDTDKESIQHETLIVGTSLPDIAYDKVHNHIDEAKQPPSHRKLGTVTSFDVVGKGATAAVDTSETVVLVEGEYPRRPYSGPSKGGRYYGGYYGKGKGGRYGYNYGDYYYGKGKGKGGRYYYHGGPSERVVGTTTTTVVKDVVEVGKGAR